MSRHKHLKQKLASHKFTGPVKQADDLSSDTSFEQSFANLAFAIQNDTNPQLSQHTLGFQLLEKDEAESKGVGVVGLQLGESIVFAPYFFREGELYGDELLWIAESDLFVPKTTNWINYLIHRKTSDLGSGIPMSESRKWVQQPDLRFLKKYSIPVANWASDFLPKFFAGLHDVMPSMAGLPSFVKESQFAAGLLEATKKYPALLNSVKSIYKNQCRAIYKTASAVYKASQSVLSHIKFRKTAKVRKSPPCKFYDDKDLLNPELSVPERQQILKKGYYIKDFRRSFSKVAELATVVQHSAEGYVTPKQSCIGKVLLKDGSVAEAIYLPSEVENLVILFDPIRVVVCQQLRNASSYGLSASSAFAPLFDISSIDYDSTEVWSKLKKHFSAKPPKDPKDCISMGLICVIPDLHWYYVSHIVDDTIAVSPYCAEKSRISTIVLSDTEKPVKAGDTLLVPRDEICFYNGRSLLAKDILADIGTLLDLILHRSPENYEIVSVKNNGMLMRLNGEEVTKKEGVWKLVTEYGVSIKDAEAIANKKSANDSPIAYLIIKSAQLPHEGVVTAPAFPAIPYMTDPILGSNLPATPEVEATIRIPGLVQLAPPKPPHNVPLNPEIIAVVQQAAQLGQKEIFDTTVLRLLIESTDDRDIIDRYLPRFVVGVDAIGRMLFNLYWHYDHFKSRLGSQDTERLQKNLRNIFKQLGEAVLTLKEKNVSRTSALTPDLIEDVKKSS